MVLLARSFLFILYTYMWLEPAQKLASESGLSARLLKLLSASTIKSYMPVVPYVCKILALVVGQQPSPSSASEEDSQAANVLLKLALGPETRDDGEEFASVVSVALAYLATEEESQAQPIADAELALFLDAFYHAQTNFTIEEEEEDSAEALKQLNTSLMNVLADITSQDSFSESHNLESTVSQKFLTWLHQDVPMLRAAACLALGNLSRSDEASTALVSKYNAHEALVDILSDPSTRDGQLLHASMSFLKNLAIPAQNKAKLSGLLEPNGLPRIYTLDAIPQVQFAAISLTRLLLLNCAENIAKMCRKGGNGETPLETAIALFGRSDAEPTKMEAARSAGTVCRGLHSLPVKEMLSNPAPNADGKDLVGSIVSGGNEDSILRHTFYQSHPGIVKLLSFLITQDKWPVLRSEAWFVFALMARSSDGAHVVAGVLKQEGTLAVLTTTITGRKASTDQVQEITEEPVSENKEGGVTPQSLALEPQQVPAGPQANTAPVDRENALVMCTELEANWNEDEFVGLDKTEIQALIKEGTGLVAAHKAKQ